ncbi:hypothetical protein Tco_0927581 [Tanacetum coccineum]
MGYYQHEEQPIQELRGGMFSVDFCSRVDLMRVLKSGKMIGGQILCSFFVSDDNIKFLEQKDPPHQSWLSIFLSEEILYSRMVVCLSFSHGFAGIVNWLEMLVFSLP